MKFHSIAALAALAFASTSLALPIDSAKPVANSNPDVGVAARANVNSNADSINALAKVFNKAANTGLLKPILQIFSLLNAGKS
ncbi:hypothetical protein EV182_001302 [Spiromyces aspiralis]|uniref:Uncharacterized protein n=1 Tax=Spiromyces aspiralis TaxID=68401 RepID=A0ACC1HTB1_9FUNG|nr:hypothetical protein EV182_001302 [Spiromyces aspiralis]